MGIALRGVKRRHGRDGTIASAPPTSYAARVIPDLKLKVVGRKQVLRSPEESFRAAMILIRQAEKLSPYPRPRGFVHKSRTYEDYTRWRRSQPNPWLW